MRSIQVMPWPSMQHTLALPLAKHNSPSLNGSSEFIHTHLHLTWSSGVNKGPFAGDFVHSPRWARENVIHFASPCHAHHQDSVVAVMYQFIMNVNLASDSQRNHKDGRYEYWWVTWMLSMIEWSKKRCITSSTSKCGYTHQKSAAAAVAAAAAACVLLLMHLHLKSMAKYGWLGWGFSSCRAKCKVQGMPYTLHLMHHGRMNVFSCKKLKSNLSYFGQSPTFTIFDLRCLCHLLILRAKYAAVTKDLTSDATTTATAVIATTDPSDAGP